MADKETWIKDGTEEAEPETTETPAGEATAEVVEGAAAVVEEVTATGDEATGAVETAGEAAGEAKAVAEVVQKFIECKLGDEAFQLPEGVRIPLKRGDEIEYVPIEEVRKRGMLEQDYRTKTTELSNERRAFETSQSNVVAERAKLEAKGKYLSEQEAEIKAALSDPESAAQYQQHLDMLQTNPMYRKTWEERWANRETAAERDALLETQDARVVQEASTTALGWIKELATDFDGVDQGRVASIYGQRLSAGQASLDISDVRSIYQAEADYLKRASEPLRDQLANLSAKIDKLTASQTAEEQNETTRHAVKRAKTIPVATGAGAPAKGHVAPERFGPNELAEKNSEWAKAG
jgi:hypothetical protein